MSQENVEIVRRALEHDLRTDEPLWDIIDPEVEIHDHDVPDAARVYRGHAEWLEWAALFDDAWEDISADVEGTSTPVRRSSWCFDWSLGAGVV